VLVNDGQTVVLGGILETIFTSRQDEDQGPVPRDVPVSWHLFKDPFPQGQQDRAFMIFITPKIVRRAVNVYN